MSVHPRISVSEIWSGLILDAGYEGVFDLEILAPKIEAEDYRVGTRRSLERASETLDRIGA